MCLESSPNETRVLNYTNSTEKDTNNKVMFVFPLTFDKHTTKHNKKLKEANKQAAAKKWNWEVHRIHMLALPPPSER